MEQQDHYKNVPRIVFFFFNPLNQALQKIHGQTSKVSFFTPIVHMAWDYKCFVKYAFICVINELTKIIRKSFFLDRYLAIINLEP